MAVAVSVTVSETAVSEPVVSSVGVGLSLSLPLGNMDSSGGVGDVSAGTSISSSYGGDGSRGSSKGGQRGRRRDAGAAGDHWVPNSVDNRGMVGVAHNRGNMASRVDTGISLRLSLPLAVDTVRSETVSPVATVAAKA